MKLVVLKEVAAGDHRVAATPETVKKYAGLGHDVIIEAGAGLDAGYTDAAYTDAGAKVEKTSASALKGADVLLSVRTPDVSALPDGITVIGLLAWMFYLSASLTLVLLTAGPLIALLVSFVTKKFRKLSKRIQSSIGDVSRIVEESIKAQVVVKVFNGKSHELSQFEKINEQNKKG